jgi:hypothetical protein
MFAGSSKIMLGLAAAVVPAVMLLFGAIAMVATGWRNWFGLQKKEPPKPEPHPPRRTPLPPRQRK